MKRKKLPLIFGVIALTAWSCNQPLQKNEALVRKVKIEKVEKATEIVTHEFSGVIKEAKTVNLAFRVAGPIKSLYITKGQTVTKGQQLAQIDSRDYQIQLTVAQAEYDKVISETNRVKELYKRNSVTQVDYQKALAGEKMVTAQLNHAKNQLEDTKIYAPFAGTIQNVFFESGELINTGMTLASITDTKQFKIEIDIPASLFIQKERFVEYLLQIHSFPNQSIALKFENYQPKANSNQLYRLIFSFDSNPGAPIALGMEATVRILMKESNTTKYIVPNNALFEQDSKAFVWVFNPSDSIISKKQVQVDGLYKDGKTLIKKGLTGKEIIVVAGVKQLEQNQKVEPVLPVSETNIGGLL